VGQRIGYHESVVWPEHGRQLDGVEVDKVFTDHASGKDINRHNSHVP